MSVSIHQGTGHGSGSDADPNMREVLTDTACVVSAGLDKRCTSKNSVGDRRALKRVSYPTHDEKSVRVDGAKCRFGQRASSKGFPKFGKEGSDGQIERETRMNNVPGWT